MPTIRAPSLPSPLRYGATIAEGAKRAIELAADAQLYAAEKQADAVRITADADAYAVEVAACADAERTRQLVAADAYAFIIGLHEAASSRFAQLEA